MTTVDEQSYRTDKVVKRGAGGKDPASPANGGVPFSQDLLLPTFTIYESKLGLGAHSSYRGSRFSENWIPKGLVLAIICLLCILALSGSFVFVHSSGLISERGIWNDGSVVTNFQSARFGGRGGKLEAKEDAWERQMKRLVDQGVTCDPRFAVLKVYMYDLPSEFHFGLMSDFKPSPDASNVWPRNFSNLPRYPGGLNQQHSIEYWLTADILTSDQPGRKHECTAVRVKTPKEADVIFVPFFASLSYNKFMKVEHKEGEDPDADLQDKLVKYLYEQRPWQESGGRDHIVVIHHPNSMAKMRDKLKSAVYVVCDFGRYPEDVANMDKDIVAPYKHVIPSFTDDSTTFESRTTLLFFQGAIVRKEGGVIRQQLNELLSEEEDVHFVTGNTQSNGIRSATAGMRNSKYCLHLAGDTPSSNRLFDAIASHCVPVVISDDIELPFEDSLDYSEFSIFIRSTDALKKGFVIKLLRGIQKDEWTRMWLRLQAVARHFDYQHPSLPADAVNMIWRAIARRSPSVRLTLNKAKRYARSGWVQLPDETKVKEE